MAGVFSQYERFVDNQSQVSRKDHRSLAGGCLKVNIPMLVTASEDPTTRWQLACLSLRLLISNSSTSAIRQGAILTLMSLPSQNMRATAAIAGSTNAAVINTMEVLSVNDWTPSFDPRSGLSEEDAQVFRDMARDLPPQFTSGSPFTSALAEGFTPEDTHDLMEALTSVLIQIWILVAKAMTNIDGSGEANERRLAKYIQKGQLNRQFAIGNPARLIIQQTIKSSLTVRRFLVSELRASRGAVKEGSPYYAAVGDIHAYIFNAGLTPFLTTLRYGIGTKYAAVALSVFAADIAKLKSLLTLYQDKGVEAGYMALLEDPDSMHFAPGNFPHMYSYAMGVASYHDPSMRQYQYARRFLSRPFYLLGRDMAAKNTGTLDEQLAKELQVSERDRAALSAAIQSAMEGGESDDFPLSGSMPALSESTQPVTPRTQQSQLSPPQSSNMSQSAPRTPDYQPDFEL
ncbi:nucleocapsid protein [avian paramyxovirus 4]|uniref:Nucleocapsid n=1 Tax=avian paramyxovirus 4 TaxID=28274 RepID=K7WGA7_9MONO|nr:nucleocapsid protein [Avian paramyxovirus 4]AFX60878.1 nucleocapsid protein [Avian paramyxovirus 4]